MSEKNDCQGFGQGRVREAGRGRQTERGDGEKREWERGRKDWRVQVHAGVIKDLRLVLYVGMFTPGNENAHLEMQT